MVNTLKKIHCTSFSELSYKVTIKNPQNIFIPLMILKLKQERKMFIKETLLCSPTMIRNAFKLKNVGETSGLKRIATE